MTTVDNKIVSITFDNANFSQRIQDTIAALGKLRDSLNLSGASKGMAELGAAAKSLDMTPMATSIEGINAKFAAMAAVGITAIANLTNRIVDAGLQITKAFALTPVTEGFAEFELKMGSIQTIMAGSGESMETVNQKLKELNEYSDKTIYSFRDMTSNIGKFTNAGVGLDQSVRAIQGVANVAALSGANAEEASRAMYNFAQAISQGSVKLIDWKSIELANMGTVEFKQQLIDSAVAMGTLTKAADGTYKTLKGTTVTTSNFGSTLNEAWLSSEALTATLERFSDTSTDIGKRATAAATEIKTFSQLISTMKESLASGWAQTFENIFGNFEQGKQLFGIINAAFGGIIQQSADARNKMLSDWQSLGGWDEMLAGIIHLYQGVKSFIVPIRDAFREIFPRTTGQDLFNLTIAFRKFAEGLRASGDTASRIKGFFRGLFGALSIVWEVVKGVVRVFFALAGVVVKVVSPLLKLVALTGVFGSGLHTLLVQSGAIKTFFDALVFVITKFGDALGAAVGFVVNLVLKLGLVTKLFTPIKALGGLIVDFFKGFANGLGIFGKAPGAIGSVTSKFGDLVGNLDLLGKATRFIDSLSDKLMGWISGFDALSAGESAISSLANAFTKTKAALVDFFGSIDLQPFLYALGSVLSDIYYALLPLGNALNSAGRAAWEFFSNLDFGPILDFLASAINSAGDAISRFFGFFGGKGGSSGAKSIEKAEYTNARFGRSIVLTTERAEKGASIFERLANAIGGFITSLSSSGGDIFDTLSKGLVDIVSNLPETIKNALSGISAESIFNILKTGALGGAMFYIVRFLKDGFGGGFLKTIKKGVSEALDALTGSLKALQTNIKADTLRKIAIAIGILAISMIGLSLVDPAALAQGLIGVTAGLGALTGTMVALDKLAGSMGAGKTAAMGAAFVAIAASMTLMAGAVWLFSRMDPVETAQGLAAVGATLGVMSGAIRLMNNQTDNVIQAGIAMGVMAVSLMLLAKAIKQYAGIGFGEFAKGLIFMALGLSLLVEAIDQMPDDTFAKAAGIVVLTFALKKLADIILLFDGIAWQKMVKGTLSIAGALTLIGKAMGTFPDDMLKTAIALGVVAIGLNVIALAIERVGEMSLGDVIKGVLGLSVMLEAMAFAIKAFETNKGGTIALVAATAALVGLAFAIQLIGGMPFGDVLKGVGGLVIALGAVGIVGGLVAGPLTALGIAFGLLGLGLLAAGAGALMFAKAFEIAAKAGKAGIETMMDGLKGFIRELPSLITAFVQGVIDAFVEIGKRAPDILGVFEQLFVELLDVIERQVPEIIKVAGKIISAFLKEVRKRGPELIKTGFELLMSLLRGIRKNIREIVKLVSEIVINFLDELEKQAPDIIDGVFDLLVTVLQETAERLGRAIPQLMIGVGRSFLQGLWDGITEELGKVGEFFRGVADTIINAFKSLFGINSPSTVFMEFGKNIIQGLLNGLEALIGLVKTFFIDLPLKILGWVGNTLLWLVQKGSDIITGIWNGIGKAIGTVTDFFKTLGSKIVGWVGSVIKTLYDKGKDIIQGLKDGIAWVWKSVFNFFDGLGRKIKDLIVEPLWWLYNVGKDIVTGLKRGIEAKWNEFKNWFANKISSLIGIAEDETSSWSPSREFMKIGNYIVDGLRVGIHDTWPEVEKETRNNFRGLIKGVNDAVATAASMMEGMGEFHPTITPVLDLSNVTSEAGRIGSLIGPVPVLASASAAQAGSISSALNRARTEDAALTQAGPTEINFVQNNYSPEALSVNDIYRNTKSQIALAKEELGIS